MSNFKLNIDQKDKKIKEYVKLLELARTEYKKVVHENNLLKRQLLGLKSSQLKQIKQIKRKCNIKESDSETDTRPESDKPSEDEEEQEDKIEGVEQYPKINKIIKKKKQKQAKDKNYLTI